MPEIKNQKQPCFTSEVVTWVIAFNGRALRDPRKRSLFFTLCAAAGLRFGEALGIDIKDISPDCTTIKIHQKVRRGRLEPFLKNKKPREVDLHSTVAAMLKDFIGERTHGLLFQSRMGKPLSQTNILKRWLHPALKEMNWKDAGSGCTTTGAHAFRRFRNTYLRNHTATPPGLIKFWMGWKGDPTAELRFDSGEEMADLYDKVRENVKFRKEVAEKAGLGFELPVKNASVEPKKPKIESEPLLEMAASL
jgi:integrase